MRVAVVQLNSGCNVDANLTHVAELLEQAAAGSADLVVLPENFAFMGGSEADKRAISEERQESRILSFLAEQALHHGFALIGGTLLLMGEDGRLRNSCPVFDSSGSLLALYDKIHLFDMDHNGEHYKESALIEAGSNPVQVDLGDWRIGLSICYDLRFPELFRIHADVGSSLLCNVAAFTEATGRAHWETLLRARAIENQCYLIASAQSGVHGDGRRTWGHSMVIDPWGEVLAELPEGEGVIFAEVSKTEVEQVRKSMPVLQHRRL